MRPESSGETEGFSGEPGPTSTLLTQSAGMRKNLQLFEKANDTETAIHI